MNKLLGSKIGPLPTVAWAGIVAVVIIVAVYMRRNSQKDDLVTVDPYAVNSTFAGIAQGNSLRSRGTSAMTATTGITTPNYAGGGSIANSPEPPPSEFANDTPTASTESETVETPFIRPTPPITVQGQGYTYTPMTSDQMQSYVNQAAQETANQFMAGPANWNPTPEETANLRQMADEVANGPDLGIYSFR